MKSVMAPSRKSRSVNKRFSNIREAVSSKDKDAANTRKMKQKASPSIQKLCTQIEMTGSQMKGYDSSKLKKVRLRHVCKTSWLSKVNKNLTNVQKSRIQATPFKWLMCLPDKIKISGTLLSELASRWDENSGGFRIRSMIISFSPLDVCFALGLRIVGDNVQFEEDIECHTKKLFDGKEITVQTIFEQLVELASDNDVEDFCRLYILLGLAEFYFPNTTPNIHGGFLKVLDDLQSLDKYNWGVAVYEFLVDSLTRATIYLCEGKNSSQLHIVGCAVVLQMWAFEHVLVHRGRTSNVVTTFPRFLKWHDVSIREFKISAAFNKNMIIEELSATKEELAHDVVREALDQPSSGFAHWKRSGFDNENIMKENQMLRAENIELQLRISHIEQELGAIKQLICESGMSMLPAGSSTSNAPECNIRCKTNPQIESPEVDYEAEEVMHASHSKESPPFLSNVLGDFKDVLDHQASSIYTRLKDHPRKRVTSAIMRTPWIKYSRKKKKSHVV